MVTKGANLSYLTVDFETGDRESDKLSGWFLLYGRFRIQYSQRRGVEMKAVILCGGKGTRMSEITNERPKPLAMIGGKPILWHIMKLYQYYGVNEFILLLGFKGDD